MKRGFQFVESTPTTAKVDETALHKALIKETAPITSRKHGKRAIPKQEMRKLLRETYPKGNWVRENDLCHVKPYYHSYRTNAKGRWTGRSITDVFRDEFKEKSPAYYSHAIETGKLVVNGEKISLDYTVRMGDEINHLVHRRILSF